MKERFIKFAIYDSRRVKEEEIVDPGARISRGIKTLAVRLAKLEIIK